MADTAQFPPGEMLDEKYRIDQLLSVGGMGAVYIGTHMLLRKRVAIKVLRTELAGSTAMIERFQREAVAASAIGHENIVNVTDMGTTAGGVAFLVMELLEGRSLAQAIRNDGPLPINAACDVAAEILSGVAAAHCANIVHRDLKPENVFLVRRAIGKGEAVKILDFGISSIGRQQSPEPRLTITGIVMGTPSYMAPEQARGDKDITYAADIYSIGVILYEMLTKQIPYEAENYNMVMYRVLSGEHVPLIKRRPEVGAPLDAIIEKALALKSRDRFLSAEEFEDALAPFRSAGAGSGAVRVPTTGQRSVPTPTPELRQLSTAETLAAGSTEPSNPGPERRTPVPEPGGFAEPTPPPARSRLGWVAGGVLLGCGAIAAVAFAVSGKKPPAPAPVAAPAPAPAPAPEPRPAPAPAPPAAPANVAIDFLVTAPGAIVSVDGKPLPGTRFEAPPSATPVQIRVEAPGHQPFVTQLTLDRSMVVPVQMARLDAKPGRRHRGERSPAAAVAPAPVPTPVEPPPVTPPATEKKSRDGRIVTDSPYATPPKKP